MEAVQGESSVGIQAYTSRELAGFAGILKQRYSDFIVREIDTSGAVAYLQELNAHAVEQAVFKSESECVSEGVSNAVDGGSEELVEKFMVGVSALVTLSEEESSGLRSFLSHCFTRAVECPKEHIAFACTVKETRTAVHKAIKTIAPVSVCVCSGDVLSV